MICVSVAEPTVDDVVRVANKAVCDVVEVRLDYLDSVEDLRRIREINKPVIATCMPVWEGGRFSGDEDKRISTLFSILPFCDYITIELKTKKKHRNKIIHEAKKRKIKVILSYHNFKKTETKKRILNTIRKQKKCGADIAKIAYKANNYKDALTVINALTENKTKIPVIAISMGEHGKITRILAPLLGAYLTFAAPEKGKETAPGQLTADEIKKIYETLKVKK